MYQILDSLNRGMNFVKQIGVIELVLGLGILATPWIPTNILAVLDLILIRLLVVLAVLWAITKGPRVGLLTFVLICLLYLERNRRKIVIARNKFVKILESDTHMTVDEEGVAQQTVPVQEFENPDDRTMHYLPREGCAANSNGFESPSETLNAKVVFPAIPGGSKAGPIFQDEGFGRIPGLSTA
jgi:hypothetical protein